VRGSVPDPPDAAAPSPVSRRAALPSLTALRAIAAAGVFISHSTFFVGRTDVTRSFMDGGGAGGVTFFFVLSGAILAYNYAGAFSIGRFYRKRFARIYPVYLLAFAVGAVVVAGRTGGLDFASPGLVTKNLFMVQGWFHDGQSVPATAWTLSCEMFFYASFPLLIMALRRVPARAVWPTAAAMVALALVSANLIIDNVPGEGFFLSPLGRVPEFAVGVLLGLHLPRLIADASSVLRRRSTQILFGCAVAAVVSPILGNEVIHPLREQINLYVPICALAIAAAAAADLDGPHWLSDHRLVLAGLWSYAFYSIHESLVLSVDAVWGASPALPIGIVLGILTFLGTGVLSWLIFTRWEEPLRERISGSRPKEVVAAGAS
jgi:peptidoglycan/LPS O-acetylase OafA/YrhL